MIASTVLSVGVGFSEAALNEWILKDGVMKDLPRMYPLDIVGPDDAINDISVFGLWSIYITVQALGNREQQALIVDAVVT